jgi:OOP family OmpA-OmpF porin
MIYLRNIGHAIFWMAGLFGGFFWPELEAQNLVPNPDFDQYDHCPPYLGQIHEATGWDSPNFATTDYFHACSDSLNGNGVPGNRLGWQQPVSGQGYAGIRLWIPPGIATPNQREYLVTRLNHPLETDSFYQISFHASLADFSTHTTDALGLGFSDSAFSNERFQPFSPALRLADGEYLTKRQSWEKISGLYRAKGGEQHLIVGNFLRDTEMMLLDFPPGTPEEVLAVYVFIDQISITPVSISSVDTTLQTEPEVPTLPRRILYANSNL